MREKKFLFAVYTNFCIIMSDRLISKWAFYSLRICLCCVCVVAHSSLVKTSALNTQMHAWTLSVYIVFFLHLKIQRNMHAHSWDKWTVEKGKRNLHDLSLNFSCLWRSCHECVAQILSLEKLETLHRRKKKHNETWWESLAGYLFAVSSRDLHGSQ